MLLIIPSVIHWLKGGSGNSCEKRTLVAPPTFHFQSNFLQECGDYFEENYGLRNEFVYWQSVIKLKLFKSSSNPDQVIPGENGYLFYTSKSDLAYGSYTKTNLLDENGLRSFKELHENRKKELAKNKIKYVLAVWPDKNTIYREFEPFQMKIQIEDTISKIDQLTTYLSEKKSSVKLIDVRKDLFSKNQQTLYFKHDTHWNSLGGFYAYKKFIAETKSVFHQTSFPFLEFELTNTRIIGGDLLNFLGICQQRNYFEYAPTLIFKKQTQIIEDLKIKNSYGRFNKNAPSKLKVVFFRDSFMDALIPYISLHFEHVYFFRSDYDQKMVDLIHPDVVVVCKVERYI